ncbi:DUF3311 domain-containing protein [Lacicoccus alkaliphilus]|uniref:DUF3311 domain-containing protein n=1 Tax=Lacicoccus alkaliphilus DSM 16010 TaxID=1123231 RepID=A0A1M7JIL1_9BACL|nr:hypothetical protein SAMN02745189_02316 [Salinicoccus alkaliphilus DSM 16010]
MKATFKVPKTKKGWISLGLVIFTLLIGIWPIIHLFNQEILIFGMPLLMFWSIIIIIVTTSVMVIINKIGGVE